LLHNLLPRQRRLHPDRRYGCHTFSSAEIYTDCVVPAIQDLAFDYFKLIQEDPGIANPQLLTAADFLEAELETKEALKEATLNEEWTLPEDQAPWKLEVEHISEENGVEGKLTELNVLRLLGAALTETLMVSRVPQRKDLRALQRTARRMPKRTTKRTVLRKKMGRNRKKGGPIIFRSRRLRKR